MFNNFHACIYPSKTLSYRARGLCVNSVQSPGYQIPKHWFLLSARIGATVTERVTTVLPAASTLDLDSLWFHQRGYIRIEGKDRACADPGWPEDSVRLSAAR
jgi:hypothetical protein